MRTTAVLVLSVSCALALGACDEERRFPTADDLDDVDLSVDHTLTVDEDGFDPARLGVVEDDIIEVSNEGDETHTITADEDDGVVAFDATLEPGDVLTLVAPGPGEITFRDREDPDHDGVLVIAPNG